MRLVGFSAVVLLLVSLTGSDDAGADRTPARACVPAAIEDVKLPGPVEVDEIRVQLREASPESGAARVEVTTGEFDRVLWVGGAAGHGLQFHPSLRDDSFRVHVDPVLSAPASACVGRVELRSGGDVVAAIKI